MIGEAPDSSPATSGSTCASASSCPSVIALAAAAVAVPVLLGGSSEAPVPSSAPPVDVVETQPAVALAAEDGIRTAAERLAGREAKNPFRQQLQSLPEKGAISESDVAPPRTRGALAESMDAEAQKAADQLADQLTGATGATESADPTDPVRRARARAPRSRSRRRPRSGPRPGRSSSSSSARQISASASSAPATGSRVPTASTSCRGAGDPVLVMLGVDDETGRATFDLASRVISVWGKGSCAPAGTSATTSR